MAYKCELTDGTTTIDLYYTTTGFSLLDLGFRPSIPEKQSIYGGSAGTVLVRHQDGRRVIPLELYVEGLDDDDLMDEINALERLLRQAQNYRLNREGDEVFLDFQLENATYVSRFPVISATVDIDRIMSLFVKGVPTIDRVPMTIECEPYWESDTDYDLENLLDNPGFEEWNAGTVDSQPDGWADHESLAAGTGTNNRESTEIEQGLYALKTVVSGIDSADYKGVSQDIASRLTAAVEHTLVVRVKNAAITNGKVQVLVVGSVSGTLGTALDSGNANDDYTEYSCQFTPAAGDVGGNVWVRPYILATSNGCSGTVYVDQMLVMEGSTAPEAWMGSSFIENHIDATALHINYIDFKGVPGEVDAIAEWTFKCLDYGAGAGGVGPMRFYLASRVRGTPAAFQHEFNPVDGTVQTDTSLAGDATAPGGQRADCDFATTPAMTNRIYWTIAAADLQHVKGPCRFLLVYNVQTADRVRAQLRFGFGSEPALEDGDEVLLSDVAAGKYEFADLGAFDIPPTDIPDAYDGPLTINLRLSTAATPETTGIQALFMLPVDRAYAVTENLNYAVVVNGLWVADGRRDPYQVLCVDTSGQFKYQADPVGPSRFLTIPAEREMRVFFIMQSGVPGVFDYFLDSSWKVTLKFRPRGIHLRGLS